MIGSEEKCQVTSYVPFPSKIERKVSSDLDSSSKHFHLGVGFVCLKVKRGLGSSPREMKRGSKPP